MPKQTTTIDVPLSGGLQQKTMEPYLEGSQLISAKNAIWTKRNAIEKRPGWTGSGTNQYAQVVGGSNANHAYNLGNTVVPQIAGMIPFGTGYSVTDGTYLYGGPTATGYPWQDFVSPCVGTRRTVGSSTDGVVDPDVAQYGNFNIFVWEDNIEGNLPAPIMFAIRDATTNDLVLSGQVNSPTNSTLSGYLPKVLVLGNFAVVFATNLSGVISASTMYLGSLPNAAWSNPQSVVTTKNELVWDVVPMWTQNLAGTGGVPVCALAYHAANSAPCLSIKVFGLNGLGVISSIGTTTVAGETATAFYSIGMYWQGGTGTTRLWLCYCTNASPNNLIYASYTVALTSSPSATLTQELAPTVAYDLGLLSWAGFWCSIVDVSYGTAGGSTPTCVVASSSGPASGDARNGGIIWVPATNAGTVGLPLQAYNSQLISRLFAVSSSDAPYGVRVYGAVSCLDNQQSVILAEFDLYKNSLLLNAFQLNASPRAMVAPRIANFGLTGSFGGTIVREKSSLSSIVGGGSTANSVFTIAATLTQTSNTPSNLSAIACVFDFGHPGRFKSVSLGGLTYTAGGMPGIYDGTGIVESSTISTTDNGIGVTVVGGSGNALAGNSTYSYVMVPEYRDALGNVHQGEPSQVYSITTGGSLIYATLTYVADVNLTLKGTFWKRFIPSSGVVFGQSGMYLIPYRTIIVGGSSLGGGAQSTTFHRTVGDDPGVHFFNAPEGQNDSLVDTASDASIAGNPVLYTTGGLLSNDTPSSFADICTHANRVYGIGDDLRTIWISTVQQDGVPCSFSDQSQTEVSSIGDLVAIWSMDDKLFAASATGIAYATGDGPNLAGQQSNLSPWNPIPTDIGVVDPRAVCVTPIGTVFRHAYGLGLLDRSLSVHGDFGDPVIDLLNTYPTTTAIVQHPTRHEILVFCTSPSNGGVVLSFNTRFQSWSSWYVSDPDSGNPGAPQCAIVATGQVQYGSPFGRTWTENAVTSPVGSLAFFDAAGSSSAYVPMTVSTGWIKPGGGLLAQGWVRQAMIQFQSQDWHQLTAQVGYDYSGSLTSPPSWVFPAGSLSAFPDCGGSLGAESKLGLVPPMARCGAFRMVYSDAQGSASPLPTTGQGPRIVGLGAMIDALPGQYRLPSQQGG